MNHVVYFFSSEIWSVCKYKQPNQKIVNKSKLYQKLIHIFWFIFEIQFTHRFFITKVYYNINFVCMCENWKLHQHCSVLLSVRRMGSIQCLISSRPYMLYHKIVLLLTVYTLSWYAVHVTACMTVNILLLSLSLSVSLSLFH